MKKVYLEPEVELISLDCSQLLVGSDPDVYVGPLGTRRMEEMDEIAASDMFEF